MIFVKIKQLDANAKMPKFGSSEAAGADICSVEHAMIEPHKWKLIPCGFAMELPAGYEAQVRPRSGLALKHGITVLNSPGTIDSDYRGPIGVVLINHSDVPFEVNPGDRIAQMVIAPVNHAANITWLVTSMLGDTERGVGGFGSTGVKS